MLGAVIAHNRRQMVQHAGDELLRGFRQAEPAGGVVHARLPVGILEAEMDVHAVADAGGIEHGRESRAVAEPRGRGARDLAQDHGMVGDAQAGRGMAGDLVLARAVFGQNNPAPRRRAAAPRGTLSPKMPCRR